MKFRDYSNYEIFEDGRIWSYRKNKFLKPGKKHNGYQVVVLFDNEGEPKTYLLHRVVWETFSGEQIPEGIQVNHIDENKENCMFSNLNLMTPKENTNWGSGIIRRAKKRSKQVGALNNGKLVMTFQSTQEAKRNGFDQSAVSACCRNCYMREGNNIYKGFEWIYL